MQMRTFAIGTQLAYLGLVLTAGTSGDEQCTYQFRASRTILALSTESFADVGGIVLAPGNMLAVSFSGIPVQQEEFNMTGVSLFVIPTFHAHSSTLLEAAVAPRSNYNKYGAGGRRLEESSLEMVGLPQNISDMVSQGTVNGWSTANDMLTEENTIWEACRYYEVGDVREGIHQVLLNSSLALGNPRQLEILLRHRSGQAAFIEGNDDTYVNNVVLQIRGDCGWDISEASATLSDSFAHTYWDYVVGSAEDESLSSDFPGGATKAGGPIRNGQRHPLCGGEYLDDCDLGPYRPTDVGDGSCQHHLNTEGCHFDGGDCCSAQCERNFGSNTLYDCQGAELDPYFCSDPDYAIDLQSALRRENSAALKMLPLSKSLLILRTSANFHVGLLRGGSLSEPAGVGLQVLMSFITTVVFAAFRTVF